LPFVIDLTFGFCHLAFMRYLSLAHQRVLFVLCLLILVILYFKFYYHSTTPPEEKVNEFVVEVSGEVKKPGIYIFQNPPVLREAIEKAGGLKEAALFDIESSSEILETGTLLTVEKESLQIPSSHPLDKAPSVPPFPKGTSAPPFLKGGSGGISQDIIKIRLGRMEAQKLLLFSIPLDLNRVSVEDLCLIPGIGTSLAEEIVTYRERRKGFRSVEELKNVKGIGDKKYKDFETFFIVRWAEF